MSEQKPKARNTFRLLIISVVLVDILVVGGVAVAVLLYFQRPVVQSKSTKAQPLNVDIYEVSPARFQEVLTGFGTVQAEREVILAAQVTGEIVEIHPQLKTGTAVNAAPPATGSSASLDVNVPDVLLKIDPDDYQQQFQQADSRIREAQATIDELNAKHQVLLEQQATAKTVVDTLREEYERLENGKKKGVTSDKDLNLSRIELLRYAEAKFQLDSQVTALPFQLTAAKERLSAARSDKERAQHDLERTVVVPPFDGLLSDVFVEQGQFVRAGEQLLRLTDLSVVEIPVSLAYDDYLQIEQRLSRGESLPVRLASNETAEARWNGTLVRAAPEADPQSRTVKVFVEVEQPGVQSPLLPGAFVHARIEGPAHEKKILIPVTAVLDGDVFVATPRPEGFADVSPENHSLAEGDDKTQPAGLCSVRRQPVTLGRRYQSLVEVTSGLSDGDQIVVTNLDIVKRDIDRYGSDQQRDSVQIQDISSLPAELKRERTPLIRLIDDSGS